MLVAITGQAQELLGTASLIPRGLWALGYSRHSSWDSGYQSPRTSCSNRAVSVSISSKLSLLPLPGAGTRAQDHRSSCTWESQGWPATCYHYCGSILNGDEPKQATTGKSLILALWKLTWIKEYELESFETIKRYSLSWLIVSKILIGLTDP